MLRDRGDRSQRGEAFQDSRRTAWIGIVPPSHPACPPIQPLCKGVRGCPLAQRRCNKPHTACQVAVPLNLEVIGVEDGIKPSRLACLSDSQHCIEVILAATRMGPEQLTEADYVPSG